MKTHLFQPNGTPRAMCGTPIRDSGTTEPLRVTCGRCWGAYVLNVNWYWHMRDLPVPVGARYQNSDQPFPQFAFAYWPNNKQTIVITNADN